MIPTQFILRMVLVGACFAMQGCSTKKPTFFPEGNGVLWIEYTHGGPHWAMCGPYRDSDSYRFEFKDKSNSYSNANMNLYINSATVKASFTGTLVIDPEKKVASIAIFITNENGSTNPLPINGRYSVQEKK